MLIYKNKKKNNKSNQQFRLLYNIKKIYRVGLNFMNFPIQIYMLEK